MKIILILIALVYSFCLNNVVTAGTFEQGLVAFEKADFAQAKNLWQPLAKKGDARAQYNLALLTLKDTSILKKQKANDYLLMSRSQGLVDTYFINLGTSGTNPPSLSSIATDIPLVWLNQQDPKAYTLQLATGKSINHLEKMQKELFDYKKISQPNNIYIYEIEHGSRSKKTNGKAKSSRYILIYGVFDSYQKAQDEVSQLPAAMKKSNPWIRNYDKLQSVAIAKKQTDIAAPSPQK